MPFVNYFLTTNQKSISAGARRFPALALPLTIAGRGATVAASGSASSCPTWPENGSMTNIRQPAKNLLLCGLSHSILMYTDSFPCMPENFPVSQQTKVYLAQNPWNPRMKTKIARSFGCSSLLVSPKTWQFRVIVSPY